MKPKIGQKIWDDKEAFLLLRCAGIISKETIALILKRSVKSVTSKAMTHGISLTVKE